MSLTSLNPVHRLRWPTRVPGLAYGGDYNPEQWPEEVWVEDVALMRAAGVSLVSVGIFSWALLEPSPGRYEFGWLDRVMDLLHAGGIAVDLATPTAAPPPWFSRANPECRPVTREGVVLGTGGRQTLCPSSPAYASAAASITSQLAARYAEHPALALWHVYNEYGAPIGACYCPVSERAFRCWLRDRYQTLEALNDAWGTSFWSQRYGDWEEIEAPRIAPTVVNPAQQLDYARFSNDELLACYQRERDILRRHTPDIPVTTNFMTTNCKSVDYWKWASEVDVVANDHYLKAERADNHVDLAMAADLSRSLAGGAPWLVMEHSTGAVSWQPRNIAKGPGEMARNSLTHLARGADGALFFQWRAARFGAEKFHSTMLPHSGTTARGWHDVVALGASLKVLSEVAGSRVVADTAIVWDWESWWALELEWRPSQDLDFMERMNAFYGALWRSHRTVDFVHPEADLSAYPLVLAPSSYLLSPSAADNLRGYVETGGKLVVSFFSGIVDGNDMIHLGGYPGALRDLLGLTVEEFRPLREGETVLLDGGLTADMWTEELRLSGASAVSSYVDGPASGGPAVTRHQVGAGEAWYISTRLSASALDEFLGGITGGSSVPPEVELVRRQGSEATYLFAINHGLTDATVPAIGAELLTGAPCSGSLVIPAGQVRVIRAAPGESGCV